MKLPLREGSFARRLTPNFKTVDTTISTHTTAVKDLQVQDGDDTEAGHVSYLAIHPLLLLCHDNDDYTDILPIEYYGYNTIFLDNSS